MNRRLLRQLAGIGGIVLAPMVWPGDAAALSCAQAAAKTETAAALPPGLLLAIGIVESGREDAFGQRTPWPWTINAGGVGRFFQTGEAAILATQQLRASGMQSIDIGCFQINLFHHSDAFPDLATGFEPLANAQAAASFLIALREELGSWKAAIAAYHSRVDAVSVPYRDRVLAAWHGQLAPVAVALAGVHFAGLRVAAVHVWGPTGELSSGRLAAGTARSLSAGPVWPRLPRVISAWVH